MSDNHPETVAKRVLEAAIPGARMDYRENQSNMEYDFDLRYPNGGVAAVEVTSSRNQILTQTNAEIFNSKNGEAILKAVKCKKEWCIHIGARNIKRIRRDADKYLAALESAGIERFDWNDYIGGNCPNEITAICRDLSVISARSFPARGAVAILMSLALGGGQLYQTSPTSAAEREIGPNKDKLGKATTKERHLVVYVDKTNDNQWIGMTSSEPPNEIPNLPAEITHLWQIAQTRINQFVVWRATSTEPWHAVELSAGPQRYSEGEKQNA